MRNYYFRVDGGNLYSIATGHITRCLKLADFIKGREDAHIYFVMKDYKEGVDLVDKRYKTILLNKDATFNEEIGLLKKMISQDAYLICDIRGINSIYINELKNSCTKFILFDDLGAEDLNPDVLINPTPFSYYEYNRNSYPDTTLLLGERFFFASPSLVDKACIRDFEKEKFNIMVSFGGADPCNITEFFLAHISPALKGHNISVVLGPAYKRKSDIMKNYGNIQNIRFFPDIKSLDEILLQNDIAFVCGGDTCIEACASGIATFIISSIYYEKKIGKLLHEKNMAYFIADIEDIKKNEMIDGEYLEVITYDKSHLEEMSRCGRKLVDGQGLERAYNHIHKEEKENVCPGRP